MPTNIYTTQEKLNSILNIDGIVPECTNEFYAECLSHKVPWGIPFDRTGTTHTEEAKQKMSIAAIGNKKGRGNKGVLKSIEHKKKLSEAKIGKTLSEEHKNNMRVAQKERWRLRKLK